MLAGATLLVSTPALAKPDHAKANHAKANPAKHGTKSHPAHAPGTQSHNAQGYGKGGCPPGLAKKSPECIPPGQARKQLKVGQRLPKGYNGYTPYNQIPQDLRAQHGLNTDDRYVYRDDRLYRVDPKTRVVEQVLTALRR